MQWLLDGLTDYFKTSAAQGGSGVARDVLPGGLWLSEAPPSTAFPFGEMTVIAAPATSVYGKTAAFSEPLIQFTIWDINAKSAIVAIGAFMLAMDDKTIDLKSGQCVNATRQGDPIPTPDSPSQDEQGRDVFGFVVSYQFALSQ